MALSKVSELMLEAYIEALATLPASHFAIVNLASTIIRLSGREGRLAVQKAQREKTASRPSLTNSQAPQAKSFRKLEFSKKNEQSAPEVPPSTFGLKRVSKEGVVKPFNPSVSEEVAELTTSANANDPSGLAAGDDGADKNETQNPPVSEEVAEPTHDLQGPIKEVDTLLPGSENVDGKPVEETPNAARPPAEPLSPEELTAVKDMKPAAIGRTFGIDRLRVTLNVLSIQYSETHSETVLGAALLKHLKGAKS